MSMGSSLKTPHCKVDGSFSPENDKQSLFKLSNLIKPVASNQKLKENGAADEE